MVDNLTTLKQPIFLKSWSLSLLEPSGTVQACVRKLHLFILLQLHAVATLNSAVRVDKFNDIFGHK